MQTVIYRWQELKSNPAECDGPLYEIWGDADALFQVAKRLELPPRPFKSEFLTLAGTPADIHGASAMREERTPRPPPRRQRQGVRPPTRAANGFGFA